jgi:hypothetical protein
MTVPAGDGPLKGNAAMNTNTLPESRRLRDAAHAFGEKRMRSVSLRLLTVAALLLLLAVAAVALRSHWTDWQPVFHQIVNAVADLWEYNRS